MKRFNSKDIQEFISATYFDETLIFNKNISWPKISIVTPSMNQGNYLERTIRSVLNQNYPNLEYIIIDGGSADNSLDIIRKYEKYLAYWISEPDSGQTNAINKGFKHASGELVGWQNSDDIFLPGALHSIVREYRKHPEYDIYFGNMLTIDENDTIINELRYTPFSLYCLLYEGYNMPNQSLLMKNNIVKQFPMNENIKYALDGEFFVRIGAGKKKFRLIREYLGCLRIQPSAKGQVISSTIGFNEWIDIRKSFGIKMQKNVPWESQFRMQKCYCDLRKSFYYIVQGDFYYILNKISRLIK